MLKVTGVGVVAVLSLQSKCASDSAADPESAKREKAKGTTSGLGVEALTTSHRVSGIRDSIHALS